MEILNKVEFWLIFIYATFEIVTIIKIHRSWAGMVIAEIFELLFHSIDEVTTKKGRAKICGMIVLGVFILFIIPVINAISVAFTSENALPTISIDIVIAIGLLLFSMVSHKLNRMYIVQQ